MPSGLSTQKRSWDSVHSSNGYPPKRPREDDPRDWKDVHLNGSSRRDLEYDSHRDRDYDRYRKEKQRMRGRGGDKHEVRWDTQRRLERERVRDDRYRDRRDVTKGSERPRMEDDPSRRSSRPRSTSRSRSRGPSRSRSQSKRPRDRDRVPGSVNEGHESEREEGEISPPASRRSTPAPPPSVSVSTRNPTSPSTQQSIPTTTKSEPEPELELELDVAQKPVEETIAERRARRQAIRAKYTGVASAAISTSERASQSPGPSSAVSQPPPTTSEANLASKDHSNAAPSHIDENATSMADTSGRASPQISLAMDSFALAKDGERMDVAEQPAGGAGEQMLAADYDPSLDRHEDEVKRVRAVTAKDERHDVDMLDVVEEDEEEDVDDMFSLDTIEKERTKKIRKVSRPAAPALITTTLDSASDPEGYYQIILGEQLDSGKYQVFSSLGKGMFANVVRARVLQGEPNEVGKEVAIKIVRSQESMYKAGLKEAQILNKLRQADPDDKKHIVHLERTFEHRGHLCLVFESLNMNLREVVKRFGKDVGLNIRAVRAYAHQLFLAMSLLRKCNIMHADIKPDNILANEQKTVLKVCDLGSASDASENEITPYLVSRFYRAPEIILGVPYDCALDIWSIGCTLYELYTGKILFPGRSNNQMLLLMMEVKGRFNSKMIKKAKFGETYFDEMGAFQSLEHDKVTGADVTRKVHITKPTRDLRSRLLPSPARINDEDTKLVTAFVDLLDKCLMLDPSRRITPKEALTHPFIRG